jgi:hypothetical protein
LSTEHDSYTESDSGSCACDRRRFAVASLPTAGHAAATGDGVAVGPNAKFRSNRPRAVGDVGKTRRTARVLLRAKLTRDVVEKTPVAFREFACGRQRRKRVAGFRPVIGSARIGG